MGYLSRYPELGRRNRPASADKSRLAASVAFNTTTVGFAPVALMLATPFLIFAIRSAPLVPKGAVTSEKCRRHGDRRGRRVR